VAVHEDAVAALQAGFRCQFLVGDNADSGQYDVGPENSAVGRDHPFGALVPFNVSHRRTKDKPDAVPLVELFEVVRYRR
jgi:hypothetical protein